MSTGFFKVPKAKNEIVKSYKPGSTERKEVTEAYNKMINNFTEIPMFINGNDVKSGKKNSISPPHDHQKVVGEYYIAEPNHIDEAIQTALNAKNKWENMEQGHVDIVRTHVHSGQLWVNKWVRNTWLNKTNGSELPTTMGVSIKFNFPEN